MASLTYHIDNQPHLIEHSDEVMFTTGKNICLSNVSTDLLCNQPWYPEGYTVCQLFSEIEYEKIKQGITTCVKNLLVQNGLMDASSNFDLEAYHEFITDASSHLRIVSLTRDLFPHDFNLDISEIISKLGKTLGFELSDKNPHDASKMHIIVRVNRPGSQDFNPPHKDIYEGLDNEGYVPQFINFWIPIAGLSQDTSLPIAPGSHLLPESQIERTREGAALAHASYRVRMIKSWNGSNHLVRSQMNYGDTLIFTPHLIHGFAVNKSHNQTRVALEFRLFKK
jgi:hypothetical protein